MEEDVREPIMEVTKDSDYQVTLRDCRYNSIEEYYSLMKLKAAVYLAGQCICNEVE